MTQPKRPERKPGYSPGTTYLQTPMCAKQIACDGINLVGEAVRERGYCVKCKEAMEKKNKTSPPLKGANTALREIQRRMILKKGDA